MQSQSFEGYRLSPQQERLWALQRAVASPVYRAACRVAIEGEVEVERLRQVLRRTVDRHEILRTTFRCLPGTTVPVQVILPQADPVLHHLQEPDGCDALPVDVEGGPVVQASLRTLSPGRHLLSLDLPALCADSVSLANLVGEIGLLYGAGSSASDLPQPLQYADLAEVLHHLLTSDETAAGRELWRNEPIAPLLGAALPFSRFNGGRAGFAPRLESRCLSGTVAAGLEERAVELAVSPGSLLLAAWAVLLGRLTVAPEVLVGIAGEGRSYEGLESAVGLLARHVPLRCGVARRASFREVAAQVDAGKSKAEELQDYFNWDLLGDLPGGGPEPPFFVACFEEEPPGGPAPSGGLAFAMHRRHACFDRFGAKLSAARAAGSWRLDLHYDSSLLEEADARRLADLLDVCLASAVADPERAVGDLDLLGDRERRRLLVDLNRTAADHRVDCCLHSLVEESLERRPDGIAAACEDLCLSGSELEARANRVARHLRRLGVGPDVPVGICLERGLDMVIGLLGVLKAGGAYLPLDPSYPRDRLRLMLEDSRAPVLVTASPLLATLPDDGRRVVCLDRDAGVIARESPQAPDPAVTPDHLAYVIYTSGSTGTPKGVMIPHGAILNRLLWMQAALPLSGADALLQKTPYSFDASVWELFVPLLSGARLVLARPGGHQDPAYLGQAVVERQITILQLVPSLLRAWLEEPEVRACRSLRRVFCGGEALAGELQERFRELLPAELHNLYGPTEVAIDATSWACGEEPRTGIVPIGRPIDNVRVYLLDGSLQPVPAGVAGELYVGGRGLARGYLGRPDLTAERFVPDPHGGAAGERLYRTGDLASHRPDGAIEFLGRVDDQVKVRGVRIEVGEIEAVLARHPGVRQALVAVREDPPGRQRLVAYVVPEGVAAPSPAELRSFLEERLPAFMLPAAFATLAALPLTPSGKLDRRSLPDPGAEPQGPAGSQAAPRTLTEELLAVIWAQALGLEEVGIHDNFFTLGGDSILSIKVLAQARERGLDFSLQQLFRSPTIAALAAEIGAVAPGAGAAPPCRGFDLIGEADRARMPEAVEDAYPLTMLQTGMLFHSDYSPEAAIYLEIGSAHLRAPLDLEALRRALADLAARHPVLRTSFDVTGFGEPLQLVHRRVEIPLEVRDLRSLAPAEQEEALAALIEEEKARRLDVTRPPLVRFQVVRRSDSTFQLMWTEHHAIVDGWSVSIMLVELFHLYLRLLDGPGAPPLQPPPAVAFRDSVAAERQAVASPEHRQFWTRKLADSSVTHLLPSRPERGAPAAQRGVGRVAAPLGVEFTAALRRLAGSAGVPLKSVLLAAHLKVLGFVSGQTDLVTGLVSNTRPEVADGERVLGVYLNTLPLRLRLGAGTWEDLVRDAFAAEWEMSPFRRYPLAEIQRVVGRRALYEVVFNYLHFHASRGLQEVGRIEVLGTKSHHQTNFPLLVIFGLGVDRPELQLFLDFDRARFSEEQVRRLGGYYLRTLAAMAEDPAGRHPLHAPLAPEERWQLLAEWNDTRAGYGPDSCLHELFRVQAEGTPEAVALVAGDLRLTYRELARRAGRLAGLLRAAGVGPDVPVGVCAGRCAEAIVAILAVLEAGGAYVPLDPAYPQERLDFVLHDTGTPVVLAEPAAAAGLPTSPARAIRLDGGGLEGPERDGPRAVPQNLAYMIYTSGSTGLPKGVMVSHRAILNRILWLRSAFPPDSEGSVLQKTPFSFDASIWEIFLPLFTGAKLVLARPDGHRDPAYLVRSIVEHQITTLQLVPSQLRVLLDEEGLEACRSLERLFCGGEALPAELGARLAARLPKVELCNTYGPTEAAIDATFWRCTGADGPGIVPIGRPIGNMRIDLLDPRLCPVPACAPGEICIGGVGLARGYTARPDLTAERFVPDPWSGEPGARLYRTGDLAARRPEGTIDFRGRLDHQVKLRGFRIEPGEIETVLERHPGVKSAVVLVREDDPGAPRLVAYVVAGDPARASAAELRAALRGRLPDFMVPSDFVLLEALPLTPNGKLDRGALPAPEPRAVAARVFLAPRSPVEEMLAGIVAEVLHAERVSLLNSFLEMGGDSLLATRVVARVRRHLRLELPLAVLFEASDLAAVAAFLEARLRAGEGVEAPPIEPAAGDGEAPLSFAQRRLWLFDQMRPGSAAYNITAVLGLAGPLSLPAMAQALGEIVRRHAVLRTTFRMRGADPVQVISPHRPIAPPLVDLGALPPAERRPHARGLAEREAQRPFDLAHGPLLRASLLRLEEEEHAIVLAVHHAVCDGWSLDVLTRELAELYAAFSAGRPSPLPELPLQYADYARWQRSWLAGPVSGALKGQLAYWRDRLAGVPEPLALPGDRPRPAEQSFRGGRRVRLLPPALGDGLRELVRQEGATLFMAGFATFQVLVADLCGGGDFLVGSPVAGRGHAELEALVGCFVNLLPLRADLAGDPSFREHLQRVRRSTLEAYAHQDVPFELLVEELRPQHDPAYNPLVQVAFTLREAPRPIALAGLAVTPNPLGAEPNVAQFDLTLNVLVGAEGVRVSMTYRSDLFEGATVDRMLAGFEALLRAAVERPDLPLAELREVLAASHREWEVERERALAEARQQRFGKLRRRGNQPVPAEIDVPLAPDRERSAGERPGTVG